MPQRVNGNYFACLTNVFVFCVLPWFNSTYQTVLVFTFHNNHLLCLQFNFYSYFINPKNQNMADCDLLFIYLFFLTGIIFGCGCQVNWSNKYFQGTPYFSMLHNKHRATLFHYSILFIVPVCVLLSSEENSHPIFSYCIRAYRHWIFNVVKCRIQLWGGSVALV